MRRIYIANAITNMPDDNRPWFDATKKRWGQAGWKVISPLDIVGPLGEPAPHGSPLYKHCMKIDLMAIHNMVDAIALGPDFLDSKGANFEILTGLFFGLEFYDADLMRQISVDATYQINVHQHVPGPQFIGELKRTESPPRGSSIALEAAYSDFKKAWSNYFHPSPAKGGAGTAGKWIDDAGKPESRGPEWFKRVAREEAAAHEAEDPKDPDWTKEKHEPDWLKNVGQPIAPGNIFAAHSGTKNRPGATRAGIV